MLLSIVSEAAAWSAGMCALWCPDTSWCAIGESHHGKGRNFASFHPRICYNEFSGNRVSFQTSDPYDCGRLA